MSTTPNQKDLLAKKSDLEGILKPDDNDVLHLPDVTITLAESGQFYLAGIDKKLLTLIGNTSGNAVTLDGDAGLTFTTSGGSSTITGITSSNGNSTSLAASQSMASAKQDKIIAGTNIQIAQDGKTISATDTTYSTFNGASASADGSTGLVPKPFIADKDKYLRGDGTWQTIQATPALNDLTDVDLTTPADGQILKYDATNQEWINANENPGVTELSGLTDVDVTTTTPTNGQGLVYNSTNQKWENANVLASASVSTLTDVNLTSLKNGQVLKYNTSTQKWVNAEDIDETNEFGPNAPTASMGKDGQIYMQYVNPATITYSTVWTGLALSHYANQPAKVEGFNPSKYYKIRVVGVSYDANVNDEKLVSEIPESSTYSGGWKIGDRMYITTQNNGTELWVYNAPSHPTYPSYITRIEAAQPSEISKVYGKIVNNWIEFPGGSGSSTLAGLSDVDITSPSAGQGLVYDAVNQEWVNGNVSTSSSIDTLTDVNLTNLTNGQILKYNSTSQEWENANESGGGGGSTVIPNPTGTPTDTLDTVSIDGTIYEIQGGGGSGSSVTTLFENNGTTSPASITLEDDLTNYDIVLFQLGATNGDAIFTMAYNVADLTVGDTIGAGSATSIFVWYYYTNSTTLTLRVSAGDVYISTIVGIKLGSGSGGVLKGLDYANAVTLTLPDHTGYDYTPTGYGVLMATSYGGAGSIVVTGQNEDEKYLTFRDDTWTTSWIPVTKDETYHVFRGSSSSGFPSASWFKFIPWLCEGSGGGGSSVTPNPQGTPTDTLSTIEIDGTIYDIEGSGGGGSGDSFITYTKTVTTTYYGWWIVEDENGNTLDPDTYVIIDISVNVRYYDVLWYQDPAGDYRATLFDINDGNTIRSSSTRTWTITYAKKDFSGGGGSSALSDLTDVTVTSPSDGQVLTYDNTSGKWVNDTPTASSSISTLTDVNLTSLSDGQILKYNATNQEWVNADESGGGSGTSKYTEEVLWSGNESTSRWAEPIVLNIDITDYDMLSIRCGPSNEAGGVHIILTSEIPSGESSGGSTVSLGTFTDRQYSIWLNKDNNILRIFTSTDVSINVKEVVGIKYGSGGGGGQIDALWEGSEAPTVNNPIAVNLTHDIDDYDYILINVKTTDQTYPYHSTCIYKPPFNINDLLLNLADGNARLYCYLKINSLTNINLQAYDTQWGAATTYTGIYGIKTGGGGGSSVTPNPTDPATDALTSIEIDGTVYSVGGGDASAEEITLSDYNALTTEEKNDGTIRFIPESSVGVTTPIDMSNPTNISESSRIIITPSEKSVEMTWDTSASSGIGATFYYSRIDVTDYDYLVYDLVTGDSYDSLHPGSENPIRDLGIGLCSSAPSTWAYAPNINWTIWNRYEVTDTNKDLGTQTLDVSELSGEYYLVIAGVAWEATISNLKYATSGGNESQIKYMDKTYGIGSDGEGYTEEVIYSATPSTAAPSTLTLTKPYTDFDMLLFNLYRSADGVMNKYDRVVLTSKLSLNDRIQLITYNEWASYDITTTTSFTLINEDRMYIGSVVGLKFGEGGGGGGSSVTPNPQGTATDTLSTIEIDGTIYDIEGSGGGSGTYTSTLLNDGTAVQNVLTLSSDYTNYDELLITWMYDNNLYITTLKLNTSDISINDTITLNDYRTRDIVLTVTSTTAFTITSQESGMGILSIRGLTYSKTAKEKSRDVLWTTGSWTMVHPITDYDEIIFKWGSTHSTCFIPSDIMTYESFIVIDPDTDNFMWFEVTDASTFTVRQNYGLVITSIDGVVYTKDEPVVFAEEMTLADYNTLSSAQKNDGTIRFIPAGSGGGVTSAYDMSSITNSYVQSNMSLTATSSTKTTVTYTGNTQIGCNWNYPTPIDVTNISTIHFKATNGSCYGGGTQAQKSNWILQIGLTASAIGDQDLNMTPSDSRWAAVADMPLANHVYEESIDVSELTGSYYLLVVAHGWNTVIEDITLDTGGAYPSQIKYMSKTYGESNLISYSTTEQAVGTWIDGSTVYEKTISISNVSLSSGSYETVDTITGLDTIISCNGYVVEGNLKYTLNDITLRVIQDGTSVKFYSPSETTWTISSGAIIIRYIKAT